MYISREIESSIQRISAQFPALLLTGPRQVGKTTLLRHLGTEYTYVTLDNLSVRELAQRDPALFLQRYRPPLIIDEIQYAPELLPHIKIAIDQHHTPGSFWLTGSQQFHLMRNISESLAGRIAVIHLHGFSYRESLQLPYSKGPFLLDPENAGKPAAPPATFTELFDIIHRGSFPVLHTDVVQDSALFYDSYIQTYLQRDIRDLTQVGDLQRFMRFFQACAVRNGQLINYSDLARDVDISVPTATRWLSLLETSHQIYLLRPWHSNRTKRIVKTPKLYFHDTGMCAHLAGWTTPDALSRGTMAGAFFENHVFNEIIKSWWNSGREVPIFFFRNRDGYEMDFLIELNRMIHPIETKIAALPREKWLKNFQHLHNAGFPVGKGFVVSLTEEPIPLTDSVEVINPSWI